MQQREINLLGMYVFSALLLFALFLSGPSLVRIFSVMSFLLFFASCYFDVKELFPAGSVLRLAGFLWLLASVVAFFAYTVRLASNQGGFL